jgi:hypothetical protein
VPPLSEHEQKILDELERGLQEESREPATSRELARRFRIGAIGFALGFALLITFFVTQMLVVGVVAFGAMVVGIVIMAGAGSGFVAAKNDGSKNKRPNPFQGWERALRDRYRKE